MNAHSIDRKTFQLADDNQLLGELIYENPLFLNAEVKLAAAVYQIKPVGVFQTSLQVTKEGSVIAKLAMNWRGEIVISYQHGEEYALKLNKFFHDKYVIENDSGEKIILLDAQFNWREFHYHYDIAYNIKDSNHSKDPLLLLLGVYATNYFVACMSGASAGMM